jgi:heme/copper-type cytochrome/quinol oxidase subunit 2
MLSMLSRKLSTSSYRLLPCLISFFLLGNFFYITQCDAPVPGQVGFQDAATPAMEGIIFFYDSLMCLISYVAVFVCTMLVIVYFKFNSRRGIYPGIPRYVKNSHHSLLEIIWTTIPAFMLLIIAIPSFNLLYSLDALVKPEFTIKIVGHQWYWTYEYKIENISIDLKTSTLDKLALKSIITKVASTSVQSNEMTKSPLAHLLAKIKNNLPPRPEGSGLDQVFETVIAYKDNSLVKKNSSSTDIVPQIPLPEAKKSRSGTDSEMVRMLVQRIKRAKKSFPVNVEDIACMEQLLKCARYHESEGMLNNSHKRDITLVEKTLDLDSVSMSADYRNALARTNIALVEKTLDPVSMSADDLNALAQTDIALVEKTLDPVSMSADDLNALAQTDIALVEKTLDPVSMSADDLNVLAQTDIALVEKTLDPVSMSADDLNALAQTDIALVEKTLDSVSMSADDLNALAQTDVALVEKTLDPVSMSADDLNALAQTDVALAEKTLDPVSMSADDLNALAQTDIALVEKTLDPVSMSAEDLNALAQTDVALAEKTLDPVSLSVDDLNALAQTDIALVEKTLDPVSMPVEDLNALAQTDVALSEKTLDPVSLPAFDLDALAESYLALLKTTKSPLYMSADELNTLYQDVIALQNTKQKSKIFASTVIDLVKTLPWEYSTLAKANSIECYMLTDDNSSRYQGRSRVRQPQYLRLLETDVILKLPIRTHIRLLVTAADVLHSWTIPSFGVKVDACPGRLTQMPLFIKRAGHFYGQCSEICGINHAFMPIHVQGVDDLSFSA